VGTLVNVYLRKHKGWFAGRVVEVWRLIDGTSHRVLFDDSDVLWIDFSSVDFEVLGEVGETSSLPAVADGAPPEKDAAEAEAYASVRVRQLKKRYQDEVYVDRNSSRRTGAYAVCGSAGSSNPRAHREEEARREAEAPSQAASDEDNAAGLESRAAAGQQPLTADEARAAAAAEGLELVPSSTNETGFKGVRKQGGKFEARIWENGKLRHLGTFDRPEEAALSYARHAGAERPGAEEAEARVSVSDDAQVEEVVEEAQEQEAVEEEMAAGPQPLTVDEAKAAAAAEGLELVLSGAGVKRGRGRPRKGTMSSLSSTGFKGVSNDHGKYKVEVWEDGKYRRLGTFATPEEAALCYARHVGAERAAAEAAEARGEGPQPLTADEARAATAAEGLELVPSSNN
jgi:acyl dehydratase